MIYFCFGIIQNKSRYLSSKKINNRKSRNNKQQKPMCTRNRKNQSGFN